MGSKPMHTFVEGEEGGEYCWHYETLARERCGFHRSAHPSSTPEPAPESEEPPRSWDYCEAEIIQLTRKWEHEDFAFGDAKSQRFAADLRLLIAGDRERCRQSSGRPDPAPEPVDVAKTIVEWLDQNVSKCQHGYITVSCGECMGRYLK